MLFQDKLTALTFLLMVRTGNTLALNFEHDCWRYLQDAGMLDSNRYLTDKGWNVANKLANEFGEML